MAMNMLLFGLTGNIGTGKSTVAWMFEELGVPVIYADKIAHETLSPHTAIWENVFKRYGKNILLEDGIIDRGELAKIIFKDPAERKFLESLIHPYVRSEIAHNVAKIAKGGYPFAIVEIPLLFEVGWEREFDAIIAVTCSEQMEIERCRKKFSLTHEEVVQRISAQHPQNQKLKSADAVIENDGSIEETKVQVERLYHHMVSGKFPG